MNTTLGRAREALQHIKFGDWRFHAGLTPEGAAYLEVSFEDKCAKTGAVSQWFGRKWPLHMQMDRSDIVRTAFKAVMTAVEHEAREHFKYRGQPIFGPHLDVDRLAAIAETQAEHG